MGETFLLQDKYVYAFGGAAFALIAERLDVHALNVDPFGRRQVITHRNAARQRDAFRVNAACFLPARIGHDGYAVIRVFNQLVGDRVQLGAHGKRNIRLGLIKGDAQ